MTTESKVSPAFQPFLESTGPRDRREAIVVYRSPRPKELPVRGRLKTLKERLDYVKDRATSQRRVEAQVVRKYQEAGQGRLKSAPPLAASSIGSSSLPVARVEVTRNTLSALAEQPDVVAVMPNQKIHLIKPKEIDYGALGRQEAKAGLTWGLKQLDIPEVWKKSKGTDINVAVLDTGVYAEHPALRGRVREFVVVDPLGRRITANPTFDGGEHGTHVCGTIAGGKDSDGVSIGVAPEANLLVAGVLLGDATVSTLIEGMDWAVQNGADVINMSLGFSYYEPKFAVVLERLVSYYGILPVVAIGNENHGNTSSPGNVADAFSVGAVEKLPRNKVDVVYFSSGASLEFPGQDPAKVTKPDVVAPGVQVYSSIPPQRTPDGVFEYTYMSGTSMATPHVAGVAALLMGAKPNAPVADIMQVLKETARHPDGAELRPDNRWGYGLIQPVEALKALD